MGEVGVCVEPGGVRYKVVGIGGADYFNFESGYNISDGGTQVVDVSGGGVLPGVVGVLEGDIDWRVVAGECDGWVLGSSGPHKVYVTYGEPYGSEVTERRIRWCCEVAAGESDLNGIADKIYSELGNDPPIFRLGADSPDPLWLLMAGGNYEGECIDLANFMRLALRMLGCDGEIGYVYGSSDTNCYSSSPVSWESRNCNVHGLEQIYVWSAGGWNNWEAVCKVGDICYAVKVHKGSPIEILREWLGHNDPNDGNYQAWVSTVPCTNPGPYPVPKP